MKILSLTLLTITFSVLIVKTYNSNMQVTCLKLQKQSIENINNPNFFITDLDYNECKESFNIILK